MTSDFIANHLQYHLELVKGACICSIDSTYEACTVLCMK